MGIDRLTKAEVAHWSKVIDRMTHEQLARHLRFGPPGHPIFRSGSPLPDLFKKRFKAFGGMTPAMSKRIGWKCRLFEHYPFS